MQRGKDLLPEGAQVRVENLTITGCVFNGGFAVQSEKEQLLEEAQISVEKLIITHCGFVDALLKQGEATEARIGVIETSFRALNHLSITLERMRRMQETAPGER